MTKKSSRKLKIKKPDVTNKGTSSGKRYRVKKSSVSVDTDYIAFNPINNIFLTKPFIDKIVICGTPPNFNAYEEETLNDWFYNYAKDAEEGKETEFPVRRVNRHTYDKKKNYKNHFEITPPDSDESVLFFFDSWTKRDGQRFLRMEFNPHKMGRKNVEWFIDWYNTTMAHSSFADIVGKARCITRIDIAVDIIGARITDFILNKNKGKSNQWHSAEGVLETYYFDAQKGKPSKIKAYDKRAEHKQRKAEGKAKGLLYGGRQVTRVEVSLDRMGRSLDSLERLINHFSEVEILYPKDKTWSDSRSKRMMPRGKDHLELVLNDMRWRGEGNALDDLTEQEQSAYSFLFKMGLLNLFEDYNSTPNWQKHWRDSVRASGLLRAFGVVE